MRVTVSLEVCPRCLGPATGGDPECPLCSGDGDDYEPVELEAVAVGELLPATRATWGWDGGDPPDPGGWEGEIETVTRSDTGAGVPIGDIPDPTLEILEARVLEAALEADAAADDTRADRAHDEARDRRLERR